MNPITLGKVIIQNFFFMRSLTHKLGEPVHLTEGECQKVFDDLKVDRMMAQKFALAINIKTMAIGFHHNTNKFLCYQGQLDLTKFFFMLHPDFMEDYLKWGRATYSYITNNKVIIKEPLNQCYRITIPLKLKNGKYYWVLQEAVCLQIDAMGNMVSHLNIYTILNEKADNEDVKMTGRIYNNGYEVKDWTQTVWKDFFTIRPFELTPEQSRIVKILNENIELSNLKIAQALSKQKNTIDVQNKQILTRAREAFPNHPFETIKDLVRFLREIGYFEEEKE